MIDSAKLTWLTIALIAGFLVYLLAPILMPFISAAILAYIADPLADKFEKKMSRTLAVTVVFSILSLVAILLLFIIIPLLEEQLVLIAEKLPVYIHNTQQVVVPWLKEQFDIDVTMFDKETLRATFTNYWREATGVAANIITSITRSGLLLTAWIANFLLMFVVTFYLLRDWDVFIARINEFLPRKNEETIVTIAKEADEVLGAFFRGQLLVMLALAAVYTIGLMLAGLDMAFLIGMISGLVSFVPYLGFIVGIVIASVAALMQYQDVIHLLYVAIVFMVGQALEGMVLTPMLVGDRIGLHPVAVIFAVLAGGQLFGFVGVLLALPVAAVIAVILRHLHKKYTESQLYVEE